MNRIRFNRTRTNVSASRHCSYARVVLGMLACVAWFSLTLVEASDPPQIQEPSEPSAKSILETSSANGRISTSPNGRIGGYRYDGVLRPTPGVNSRFPNNALYGSAGNVVGVDHGSASSRFQGAPSRPFQSSMDFNVLALRNEARRARAAQEAQASGRPGAFDSGAPRLVTAREPDRFPYALDRRPNYGRRPGDPLASQNAVAAAPDATVPAATPDQQGVFDGVPERLWMRGPAPQAGGVVAGDYQRYENEPWYGPYNDGYNDFYNASGYYDARLGGTLNIPSAPFFGPVGPAPAAPSRAQTLRAFQEYLEAQLLQSPDVNPLSPVQVSYQDGVVTVRGVVPTPAARVAAGNILLADPRVSKVNNLMTYVRADTPLTAPPATPANPAQNAPNAD
ncbi:MAG: BON domain-containing protein [Thermoguttaceae bacterium]|jgi:hypothetical protein